MHVEVNEDRTITVNGKKFTFEFFEALTEPDEEWLYRFRKVGDTVTITKVMRLAGDTRGCEIH